MLLFVAWGIAFCCVAISWAVSVYAIFRHLVRYKNKVLQSLCVRILGMVGEIGIVPLG